MISKALPHCYHYKWHEKLVSDTSAPPESNIEVRVALESDMLCTIVGSLAASATSRSNSTVHPHSSVRRGMASGSCRQRSNTLQKGDATNQIIGEEMPKDDLFLCLRPILAAGQLLGCFPFGGAFRLNKGRLPVLTFWNSLPFWIATMLMAVRTVVHVALLGISVATQTNVSTMFPTTLSILPSTLCKFHVWISAPKYLVLFREWRCKMETLSCRRVDKALRWKFLAIFLLLFFLIFVENWLNTTRGWFYHETWYGGERNASFWKVTYALESEDLTLFFPRMPEILQYLCIIESKLALYGGTIMSIFQICLVMVINRKLQDLIAHLQDGSMSWTDARRDYVAISDMVELVNDIISAQILPIMVVNLYFSVSWVYMAIHDSEKRLLDGIFTILAISFLILRFFMLCIPAGNIHEASRTIWRIVTHSPDKEYDTHVRKDLINAQRLERLTTQPLGITCLGLFTITRSFVMSFLNAVFTLVIVLLQVDSKNGS